MKEGVVYEGEFFSPLAAYLPGLLPKQSEVARYVYSQPPGQTLSRQRKSTTLPQYNCCKMPMFMLLILKCS